MLLPHIRRCSCVFLVLCAISNAYSFEGEGNGVWNWSVIGPFENRYAAAFTRQLDAERPFDTLTYRNARGGKLRWKTDRSSAQRPLVFHNYNPEPSGAYVANTFVDVGSRQSVTLYAYIVGTAMVYVNDSLAFSSDQDVVFHSLQPVARVTLENGWNRILVKAGNSNVPMSVAHLVITDGSGKVIRDFASTSEPSLYPLKTAPPEPLTIPNSGFTPGYNWNDSIADSVALFLKDAANEVSDKLQQASELKQRGSQSAALDMLRAVTTTYPERFDAWFLKAYTHHEIGQKDSAIVSITLGLETDPGAMGPYLLLRKLTGQPDIFSLFQKVNTDSTVKAGFSAEPSNNGDVDIILNDERVFVLSGGSSVHQTDRIYRALNPTGARLLSQWPVREKMSTVSMEVVDYKHYGDSVQGKLVNNEYQLDNVAVGDLVRVRMRELVRDSTVMPLYFNLRHNLQREYYTHRSLYQIVIPKSERYQWRSYNTVAEPHFIETTPGYHLAWEERGMQQLPFEVDAPRSEMMAMVETGTVPSWEYVAQRYMDAFRPQQVPPRKIVEIMDNIAPAKDSLQRMEIIQRVREYFMNAPVAPLKYSLGQQTRSLNDIATNGPRSNMDLVQMFVSMLSTRGITSHPMVVDTTTSPYYQIPLPSAPFNHAIVVVTTDSLPAFFDLSRLPYASIASTPTNVRGAFGLVARQGLREAMVVNQYASMTKYKDEYTSITPLDSGGFRVFESVVTTETDSALIRRAITLAQQFRAPDGENSDSVWCTSVAGTPLLRFCRSTTGSVPIHRSASDTTVLLYDMPLKNAGIYPELPYDTAMRKLPLLRRWTYDSVSSTIVIHAPLGYTFSKDLPKGAFNAEGLRYSLVTIQRGDSLVVTRKVVNTQPYVSPEGYVSFQVAHARMIELDKQPIQLVPIPVDTGKRKKKK